MRHSRTKGLLDAWKDIKQIFSTSPRNIIGKLDGFARGNEAVHYVDNIRRYYDTLVVDTQHGNNLTEDELIEKLEREHPGKSINRSKPLQSPICGNFYNVQVSLRRQHF